MSVSEKIGLGCWGLGGDSYGDISLSDGVALLRYADEAGIRFFDLSNLYGAGRAEVIFGEWLSESGCDATPDIEIVSKAGLLPHTGFEMPTDFRLDSLRTEIQRSCIRVGINKLPIFLLHSPTTHQLLNLNIEVISETLKSEQLIKQFGVSVRSPSDLSSVDLRDIDWVELNFNLMDMRFLMNNRLADRLMANDVKVIARTPLAFGFLTSRGVSDEQINKPNSHLRNWSKDQIRIWRDGAEKFKQYANGIGLSIEQLAISFCASCVGIDKVIPGAMKSEHIQINLANTIQLTKREIDAVRDIYEQNNFYVQEK